LRRRAGQPSGTITSLTDEGQYAELDDVCS
jgi:hypothetical protein